MPAVTSSEEEAVEKTTTPNQAADDDESTEKKPSKVVQLWQKTGLDVKTLLMMFKGSLPPTIAIAIYQATDVAKFYSSLGYLVAIASVLGMCIMPRGKFIQSMILNCIIIGLGAAINLLALFCVIKAREHTQAPGSSPVAYNSSASAVAGVWLFVQVYLANYLRNARAQFRFPIIIYSIFAMISMLTGPTFPNMAAAIAFMIKLIETFLTGFGIAVAVHFVIIPVSSRTVVFAEMTGYVMSMSGVLKAQVAYMKNLQNIDPIQNRKEHEEKAAKLAAEIKRKKHAIFRKPKGQKEDLNDLRTWTSPENMALQGAVGKVLELHAKLNGDVPSTHTEFALGHLEAHDIDDLWSHVRKLLIPILGLMSIIELVKDFAYRRHWTSADLPPEDLERNKQSVDGLHSLMISIHEPFQSMTKIIEGGFVHILITLGLQKAPKKKKKDDEEKADVNAPGSPDFSAHFKQQIEQFKADKNVSLREYCKARGVQEEYLGRQSSQGSSWEQMVQRQLFVMLYIEYLILRIAHTTLDIIIFAEELKQSDRFKRRRLIFPGSKALYNWATSIFRKDDDLSQDEHLVEDTDTGASEAMYLGEAFGLKKDPEHLPPQNSWERIGDKIRLIPKFFKNENSAFGFRVAAATMSIAIVDYLEVSQSFFQAQRLVWALIMVAISMSRTAGQSTFNFLLRVVGTFIAMIGAYICWYIVDGQRAGVIVFLWLWIFCSFYVVFKIPKYLIVGILSIVTVVLILGYELQIQKLGAAAQSSGQPAYPTYLLAPYRLACVAGGLFVAWIWTIWPYPISENSELRKDLGASLYMLANYYALVQETVKSRATGPEGAAKVTGTHAYNLDQAKTKVIMKLTSLLAALQENSSFAGYQLMIGGRFPSEHYEAMGQCVRRIFTAIALMNHASETFAERASDPDQSQWVQSFREVFQEARDMSNQVTSTLSLLSSSLTNGQPLPPYMHMQIPQPFEFIERLQAADSDLLSISHIAEPEYSAAICIQYSLEALNSNLQTLREHVKAVVGEMDFSFHAIANDRDNSIALTSDQSSDDMEKK